MKLLIFTIYDEKAFAFLPPFFLPKSEMAIRTFADCVNDKEHKFGQHPEDYTMFIIGEFDDETSTITPNETSIPPIKGITLVQNQPIGNIPNVKISDETPIQPSP